MISWDADPKGKPESLADSHLKTDLKYTTLSVSTRNLLLDLKKTPVTPPSIEKNIFVVLFAVLFYLYCFCVFIQFIVFFLFGRCLFLVYSDKYILIFDAWQRSHATPQDVLVFLVYHKMYKYNVILAFSFFRISNSSKLPPLFLHLHVRQLLHSCAHLGRRRAKRLCLVARHCDLFTTLIQALHQSRTSENS